MITQSTKLNLIPGRVFPHVNVVQYDYGSRTLEFPIWNGEQRFTLTNAMTAQIQGTKPDGHGYSYTATVDTTNNIIVADLTQQMTAVKGDCISEIVISKTGERIGTLNFVLVVQPAALNDDTIVSDTELPNIIAMATEQMLDAEAWAKGTKNGIDVPADADQYHNNAKYWSDQAEYVSGDAEAWAVGTKGGIPVSSDDPTYQNNSKYYSEQADTSATNAANSEAVAIQKATDASNSASAAAISATTAANSATQSANSAYAAATSATDAANSANAAALSETNAATSEANAAASEVSANNSASRAATSELNASNSALDSEAWAIGERGGVLVPSSDVTYENNSKYYAGVSHSTYLDCILALQNVQAIYTIVRQFLGTLYLAAESGDTLATESGDKIVLDY